jgi:hypothetical protein
VVRRIGGSVDLSKLDCERAEWDLLGTERAWHPIRRIRMGYHLLERFGKAYFVDVLNQLGFTITSFHANVRDGILWADRLRSRVQVK